MGIGLGSEGAGGTEGLGKSEKAKGERWVLCEGVGRARGKVYEKEGKGMEWREAFHHFLFYSLSPKRD